MVMKVNAFHSADDAFTHCEGVPFPQCLQRAPGRKHRASPAIARGTKKKERIIEMFLWNYQGSPSKSVNILLRCTERKKTFFQRQITRMAVHLGQWKGGAFEVARHLSAAPYAFNIIW
ncbi:hypothetical protein CEXT_361911 [Caerostris extrusa]|uniref:Uncharacterized protein n=1 Tax=Caerostris extrusa TaxID=172846 RepID=A0AAV4Y0L0_CAEEX|nr:hypothetical protein CEXT_361911 [Caerostris extrusa]